MDDNEKRLEILRRTKKRRKQLDITVILAALAVLFLMAGIYLHQAVYYILFVACVLSAVLMIVDLRRTKRQLEEMEAEGVALDPEARREMEKLVNLYVQEGFAPETVMLCVAYVASRGKRTMGAVSHELKVWRAEGVETGEQADAHLQLLALRAQREQYVSSLLGIADTELTLGGRKAIARWYEVYGYDDAMVQEAAVQAGPKRDLWYWNSILKTWNAKGLRTVHDVRGPVAGMGASRNLRVDREAPSGNDFLKNAARRRPLKKKPE